MQRPKFYISIQGIILISIGLLLSCSTSNLLILSPGPHISIQEPTFDFGFVPQNSTVSHNFVIKSIGTDTLQILRVVPGCGCVQVELTKNLIPPRDSSLLHVRFETKRARSKILKRPRIESNAESNREFIAISANVVRRPDSTYPIVFKPHKWDISQFGPNLRDSMKFRVNNLSKHKLDIKLVSWTKELFEVTIPKTLKGEAETTGFIKLKSPAYGISFEGSVTFELDDSAHSRFTVPVRRQFFLDYPP